MDPKFQTSFIPKKPLSQSKAYGSRTIGILPMIATIIFVLALLAAAGVFAYDLLLKNQIGSYQSDLERARSEFDPSKVAELIKLDKRIEAVKSLLASHWSASKFFKLLENNTLKTVQFTSFDFSIDDAKNVKIIMGGRANSFSSVALQSDRFNSDPLFKNTIVSDIKLEQFGTIAFIVTTSIDPSVISYKDTITGTGQSSNTSDTTNTNVSSQTNTSSTQIPVGSVSTSTSGVVQKVIETPVTNTQNQTQ